MSDELNNEHIFEDEETVSVEEPQAVEPEVTDETAETIFTEENTSDPADSTNAFGSEYTSETAKRQEEIYGQSGMQGQQNQQYQQNVSKSKSDAKGYGIAAFVLGIISLCLFCGCIHIPLAITGIVLAIIQLASCREKAFAVAGLVMNILSIVFCLVFWGLLISNDDLTHSIVNEYQNEIQDDNDISPFMKDYMEEFEKEFGNEIQLPQDSIDNNDSLENHDSNTF